MKVKVKGLVFVGFAAAILSANAMADNENTVTSKSFTEATYQHKSTTASIGNTGGTWTPVDSSVTEEATSVPTTQAVKTYVDNAINGVTGGASSTYQTKSSNNYQIGGANGAWADLGAGFANGAYTTKSADANGVVTIDANATTDGTLPVADADKLPTASAVKTYVDSKTGANIVSQQVRDGTTATAPSEDAVHDFVTGAIATQATTDGNTYQIKSTEPSIGGNDGSWTPVDTTVSSTGTSVPTTAAVYNAIQNATGNLTIPAQDPTKCTAATPCALVDEAGTLHWRTMATATHDGGVLGDAQ